MPVQQLYRSCIKWENKLGGGEGLEGIYGSLTQASMARVIMALAECGLGADSHLLDVGAGLGRPLLHALVSPGVAAASGYEIDSVKCAKAAAFLQQVARELAAKDVVPQLELPQIYCCAIEKVQSLDPCTHAFSFWEGLQEGSKRAFGRLFARSRTLRAVAVVQRAMRGRDPAEVMADLEFGPVLLIASFAVTMSGSGSSFTAYVFTKPPALDQLAGAAAAEAVSGNAPQAADTVEAASSQAAAPSPARQPPPAAGAPKHRRSSPLKAINRRRGTPNPPSLLKDLLPQPALKPKPKRRRPSPLKTLGRQRSTSGPVQLLKDVTNSMHSVRK